MRGALKTGIVVLATLILTAPAYATFPGENGKIAFVSCNGEVWVVNPDGTGLTQITNSHGSSTDDQEPVWSPANVSSRIAFASDPDANNHHEIYTMNPDGSGPTRVTFTPTVEDNREPAWSADGSKIAFTRYLPGGCSTLAIVDANGGVPVTLDPTPYCERRADWSPVAERIAFTTSPNAPGLYRLYTVAPDGSGLDELASGITPSGKPRWSPERSGLRSTASRSRRTVTRRTSRCRTTPSGHPTVRSCCGGPLRSDGNIFVANERGGEEFSPTSASGPNPAPDWQALPGTPAVSPYPRPKGATPFHTALVPAQRECTSPDRVHGPPLAFGSCASPTLASDFLTVGTPDANGQPAKSSGFMRLEVLVGDPGTAADEADVAVTFELKDVRCRTAAAPCTDGSPPDYDGELQAIMPMQITDRFNGGLGTQAATAEAPFQSRITIPCFPTSDLTVGSSCLLSTTLDAVVPGQIREGKRAVWGLGALQIVDGGADGQASTDDYTLFAVPGVFIP